MFCESETIALIEEALIERRSIPREMCLDPFQFANRFQHLLLDRDVIIEILASLRYKILKRIHHVRAVPGWTGTMDRYLEKQEILGEHAITRFIASFVRNNLIAIDLLPAFFPSYREKTESLGGKLYHIEDILHAMTGSIDGHKSPPPEGEDDLY